MGAATPTATHFAGIDVSKDTLDCYLLLPGGRSTGHTFANDARGHTTLIAWADRLADGSAVHFCLEATGPYSDAPATALADAGRLVSVVNPTRIKYAGLARGRGNKTNKADARLIAEYAAREHPPAWQPPPPEVRELQGLVRRIDDLVEAAARDKGRLASPALTAAVRQSVTRTVRLLEREAARLRAQADALVAATPSLRADRELLESIPGSAVRQRR
jgi:transposase